MKRRYLRTLNWCPAASVSDACGDGRPACLHVVLCPRLGGEFMPQLEEGNLWIRAIMPRTTSLRGAARIAPRLREVIASVPEVRGVMSQVGRPDDGTDVTSFFNLEFNVPLKPMEEWRTRRRRSLRPQVLGPDDHLARRSRTN